MVNIKPRLWSEEEIKLISDVSYSCREISVMLDIRPGTVRNKRKALGIRSSQSLVMTRLMTGKLQPKRLRQVEKQCLNEKCKKVFHCIRSSKKKYCSRSCSPGGPKGIGTRSTRNPNIKEYKRYSREVHKRSHQTYLENIDIINPNRYNRTLCGVPGGWQLDHIKSVKDCFKEGVSAQNASSLENLRILPWRENVTRYYHDNKDKTRNT